jgi:hypothetical protein
MLSIVVFGQHFSAFYIEFRPSCAHGILRIEILDWMMRWILYVYMLLAQGQTQGSTLQQRTNKTLTTGPFGNTCEADEVSPEVEAGVVAGLQCLQP